MTISFQDLVDDILVRILCTLVLGDVLSVRQTSKRLQAITNLRAIWHDQFCFGVLSNGLPIPGSVIPLPEIPTLDLEWRTRFTIQLQRAWTRPVSPLRPVLHRSIPTAQQVALRTGGRELLTLHSNRIITWRLDGSSEVATENIMREHTLGTDSTWRMHKGSGSFDTIAISNSSRGDVFIFSGALDGPPLHRYYSGKMLGVFDQFLFASPSPELANTINIHNWVDPSFGVATIHPLPSSFGKLVTIVGFDSHLVVLWESFLTIYPIPTLPEAGQFAILDPIQLSPLRFPIHYPVVCTPCTPLIPPDRDSVLPLNLTYVKTLSIYCNVIGAGWIYRFILTKGSGGEGTDAPPFHLTSFPIILGMDCARIRVGHGGRGLWWDSYNRAYRCSAVSIVTAEGSEHRTSDVGQRGSAPFWNLPKMLRDQHGDWALDFDEGMGRIAYCDEAGFVSIVDVVHGPAWCPHWFTKHRNTVTIG